MEITQSIVPNCFNRIKQVSGTEHFMSKSVCYIDAIENVWKNKVSNRMS